MKKTLEDIKHGLIAIGAIVIVGPLVVLSVAATVVVATVNLVNKDD